MNPFFVAGLLALLGLLLLVLGSYQRTGLPHGRIVYIDARGLTQAPETLYDPRTGLTGRPDYLMQTWRSTIPVELKSSAAPTQPYDGHILQLAAYCHLVEVTTGRRPSHGIIRYRDHSFRVDYKRALRQWMLRTLERMRDLADVEPKRSHQLAMRCRACGFRSRCDQVLA